MKWFFMIYNVFCFFSWCTLTFLNPQKVQGTGLYLDYPLLIILPWWSSLVLVSSQKRHTVLLWRQVHTKQWRIFSRRHSLSTNIYNRGFLVLTTWQNQTINSQFLHVMLVHWSQCRPTTNYIAAVRVCAAMSEWLYGSAWSQYPAIVCQGRVPLSWGTKESPKCYPKTLWMSPVTVHTHTKNMKGIFKNTIEAYFQSNNHYPKSHNYY